MIQTPQPDDVPEIERIAAEAGVFNHMDLAIVREMIQAFLHPEPRDDHTFVVYRNGGREILGFACYGPAALTDRIWDLYWICVKKNHQKNGIGKLLLQQVEQDACRKGARALYLDTSDTAPYTSARAFYERNGYECIAHMDDYYEPGDGKVVYRKVFRKT